jgi:hypothetical protein
MSLAHHASIQSYGSAYQKSQPQIDSPQQTMATLKPSTMAAHIGLPTPGTPPADDFDQRSPALQPEHRSARLSTPVSPEFGAFRLNEACSSQDDQVLYPDYHKASPNEKPLFDDSSRRSPSPSLMRNIILQPPASVPTAAVKPSTYDSRTYLRAIPEHVVGVLEIYNHDPLGYARYISEQNDRHRAMRRERAMLEKTLPYPTVSSTPSRDAYTWRILDTLSKVPRVKKGKPYSCPSMTGPIIGMPPGSPDGPPLDDARRADESSVAVSNKRTRDQTVDEAVQVSSLPKRRRGPTTAAVAVPANSQPPATKRRRRTSSVAPMSPGATGSPGQSAKSKSHTRAQASKKVDDDLKDTEWARLVDYCPDTASLDAPGAKRLRVSWGTSDSLDLSNDPDAQFMHPQEIELAATLRFHCNQYLINKRRIFKAKVRALEEGKAFNKTACQQCTAMDVNKASKLWSAFDEVGWFDEHWFRRFL